LTLPDQVFRLEEANLPTKLARLLAGRTVPVRILPEEEGVTHRPDAGEYQPVEILFTNPEDEKVWRFPRRWLSLEFGKSPLDPSYSGSRAAEWTEQLHLPTRWDLSEINIDMSEAVIDACGDVADIRVRGTPGKPIKVSWQDPAGTLWRIPHDWRRRRIRLPAYDVLISNEIEPEVARYYAGEEVSVNYHPGSRCCDPDAYRFRDFFDRRWTVKRSDCVLLGYGTAALTTK